MMSNKKRKYFFIGLPLVVVGILFYAGHLWGLEHARYMTGGTPHPSNCFSCHLYLDQDAPVADMLERQYLSPHKLAISSDGENLLVTAHESNQVIIIDASDLKVKKSIPVGNWPHSVIAGRDNKSAYVSNHWSGNVSVVDLETAELTGTLTVGGGPSDLVVDKENRFLYVANSFSGNVTIIDLENNKEIRRIPTGNYPIGMDISPDGGKVYVTHRRSMPVGFREPPVTEIAIIDTRQKRVVDRKAIHSAHIIENITFTPSGDLALFTLIRPKNLVPSTQIEKGWMITEGIGIIETREGGKTAQLLLDEPSRYFADPYDVVVSPDNRNVFVSHSGVDYISVVSLEKLRRLIGSHSQEELDRLANHLGISPEIVTERIKTGPNPKGLVLSADGNHLYIAERYADKIGVIDTRTLETTGSIDLGGPETMSMVRRGGRLFYNAGRTFQNQYSCSTCHPDGAEDGLTWDLTGTGRNLENVITLRELSHTSPFKWNGKNVSVYMQCGMRFSKFVTRTESFDPDELNALVAFIFQELENPPNIYRKQDGGLTEAQKRGKEIFERTMTNYGEEIPERDRCITCHPPPYFTDRSSADVGSGFKTDTEEIFDTPKLNNVVDSPPYLHDGRAGTLEEIWTVYGEEDRHGYVNDMTKMELNDLIEYLKSIGPAHTYLDKDVNTKQARYE